MTPYEINVLLHIYAHGDNHPDEKFEKPVYQTLIAAFLDLKLIEPNPAAPPPGYPPKTYVCTKRGNAYVELGLMQVPLPVNEWRIPVHDGWSGDQQP